MWEIHLFISESEEGSERHGVSSDGERLVKTGERDRDTLMESGWDSDTPTEKEL